MVRAAQLLHDNGTIMITHGHFLWFSLERPSCYVNTNIIASLLCSLRSSSYSSV